MPANPSQTDPARRALNIDTACNLAIIYHSPFACQAPDSCHAPSQPSSHGTRVTDAHDRSNSPPTRPRGPMPQAYRQKSSDFLPTSQHGGDGPRPTNASGAPSTASGTRSTDSGARSTTSRVRWKIPTPLGTESVTDAERIEIMREELREVHHRVRVHEVSYGGGRNRRENFARVEEGEREEKSVEVPPTSAKDD
ncbi:hypothetical protein K523DRAFT_323194 [Schizophyllum commune Tattone D]|nr:hypothetical protein K523DRAFT_323194 [Schizophyllum commune Tattone D]